MSTLRNRPQSQSEIEAEYATPDPWGYFANPEDSLRREILIGELSAFNSTRVLDIGCGNGFITESIPGTSVTGVDISSTAIHEAKQRSTSDHIEYQSASLFELNPEIIGTFDCIVITGVLYGHYIGKSLPLVYQIVDSLLEDNGTLLSVHIDEWYFARFPYALIKTKRYKYRKYTHRLEVYKK